MVLNIILAVTGVIVVFCIVKYATNPIRVRIWDLEAQLQDARCNQDHELEQDCLEGIARLKAELQKNKQKG